MFKAAIAIALALAATSLPAQPPVFHLPTPNRALFEPGGEEAYFVGTVGRTWTSGTFGCVRSEGWQMHEGLDIRCVERDRRGEPQDPVFATADGTVVYLNPAAGRSTYGIYVIVHHAVEKLHLFSLYAHLREIRDGLQIGHRVKAGDVLGVMGRTTNTRQRISKTRAHLHFELALMVNPRFAVWQKQSAPDQRNDHGNWNGRNFIGIDSRLLFLSQHRFPTNFSVVRFIARQPELCRVLVRKTNFPWLGTYAPLVASPGNLQPDQVVGYELHLDYNGLPVRCIPRGAEAFPGDDPFILLGVNEAEYERNPCRRLVVRQGDTWRLGRAGLELLELLVF